MKTFAKNLGVLVGAVGMLGLGFNLLAAPPLSSPVRSPTVSTAAYENADDFEPSGDDGFLEVEDTANAKTAPTASSPSAVSTINYSGEYNWCQGSAAVGMGSSTNRVCFLTRVTGMFEGSGEMVRTYVSNGAWILSGQSLQKDVCATARCVYWTN